MDPLFSQFSHSKTWNNNTLVIITPYWENKLTIAVFSGTVVTWILERKSYIATQPVQVNTSINKTCKYCCNTNNKQKPKRLRHMHRWISNYGGSTFTKSIVKHIK